MTTSEQPQHTDTRPIILVIDDELGPRESLRFLLKDDYQIYCAESVERGLSLMRKQSPDTVIMDIRMPVRNGIDGLREIRKIDADLAVIMLTGFAAVGTAQEAIRNEASDYMEKPFDAAEMRSAVRRHVEQTSMRRKRNRLLSDANTLDQRIQELQGKNRLAELGQSSAEFVHDLRNAITLVTSSTFMLRQEVEELQQRQVSAPSEAGLYLNDLESAMQRCVEMLDTWQRLIHHAPQQQELFRVNDFASSCVEACRPAAQTSHARLTYQACGDDVELFGDRVQLVRVLTNLIHNAIHALPKNHGEISVRSQVVDAWVSVSVADNGCGISEENLQHIFSPDFTTRRKLGGMGLGLFIAQKVAQSHNGTVTVESALGQGSTFTLRLPRSAGVTGGGAA
jgi:signal transduction histidine kinase